MQRLRLTAVLWVAAGFASTAGAASAASGIKLCVPKREGAALLTPTHGRCNKNYRLRTLGAEGKQGNTGPTGNAGGEGKPGPVGSAGFTAAEAAQLKALLPYLGFVAAGPNGEPTVRFTGVNVQVVNGSGEGFLNGLGNLIIGYDEEPGVQSGSHNLVVGLNATFTSYGGIIGGNGNAVRGPYGAVLSGRANTANQESAVVGGFANVAGGGVSAVVGGWRNEASGLGSSVLGGESNTASGARVTVSGGLSNSARGTFDSILGGTGGALASNSKCGTIPAGPTTC